MKSIGEGSRLKTFEKKEKGNKVEKRVSFKGYLNRNETKRLFSSQTKKEE